MDYIMCSLQDQPGIPKCWILLHSQSTVDVFSNKKLLTNIPDTKWTLTLYFNAGRSIVTQKATSRDMEQFGIIQMELQISYNCLISRRRTRLHMIVLWILDLLSTRRMVQTVYLCLNKGLILL